MREVRRVADTRITQARLREAVDGQRYDAKLGVDDGIGNGAEISSNSSVANMNERSIDSGGE